MRTYPVMRRTAAPSAPIAWPVRCRSASMRSRSASTEALLAMKLRANRPGRDDTDIATLMVICDIRTVDAAEELARLERVAGRIMSAVVIVGCSSAASFFGAMSPGVVLIVASVVPAAARGVRRSVRAARAGVGPSSSPLPRGPLHAAPVPVSVGRIRIRCQLHQSGPVRAVPEYRARLSCRPWRSIPNW